MTELLKQAMDIIVNASAEGWGTLVKQAIVEGYTQFAWGIFWLVLTVIGVLVTRNLYREYRELEDEDYIPATLLAGVFTAAFVTGVIYCVTDGLKHIINPEFYAIRYIISQLGGG